MRIIYASWNLWCFLSLITDWWTVFRTMIINLKLTLTSKQGKNVCSFHLRKLVEKFCPNQTYDQPLLGTLLQILILRSSVQSIKICVWSRTFIMVYADYHIESHLLWHETGSHCSSFEFDIIAIQDETHNHKHTPTWTEDYSRLSAF